MDARSAGSRPPPAYVLGGGLIALGIIRSLGRQGVPITLFEDTPEDIAFHSRYVRVVRLHHAIDHEGTAERILLESQRESQKPVLFVCGDRCLLAGCRAEQRLRQHLHVVLPPLHAAETVNDKGRFQAFAKAHDIPVPRGWNPRSRAELEALLPELTFPLALKPVHSSDWQRQAMVVAQGHLKLIRVDTAAQLLVQWERITARTGPPLLQEFIQGDDTNHFSYVSYRDRDGRELVGLCVQKLRLHPIHGGLATLARIAREPTMESAGRRVLDHLGYRSVASVCFKRDAVTGEARIFEINGRLPLVHSTFLLAGIDLPWLMYRDAQGLSLPPPVLARPHGYWLTLSHDIWAAREYVRAREMGPGAWLRSLLRVRIIVEFDPRDPGPSLYFLRTTLRGVWRGLSRRLRAAAASLI